MVGALAGAAGAKLLGGLAGGYLANQGVDNAMRDYRNNVNKGTGVLQAGQEGANTAYSPYTQAGSTGITGLTDAITNRQQAPNPTLAASTPGQVSQYLDPSMAYTQDQAAKQTAAQGIAGGALGGGMLKALSNNANKMAQGNWNNAYNQMLQSNNQNFGQQQQLYTNNNDYQQAQIGNLSNLANVGLSANNANQQLQSGYNTGINQNWGNIAGSQAQGQATKAGIWSNLANQAGDTLSQGISSIWGGKK